MILLNRIPKIFVFGAVLGLLPACGGASRDGDPASSRRAGPTQNRSEPSSELLSECQVHSDQLDSFLLKLEFSTVTIKGDDRFTSPERLKLEAAVAEWNQISPSAHFLVVQWTHFSDSERSQNTLSCEAQTGTASEIIWIREDDKTRTEARLEDHPAELAVTTRCFTSSNLTKQATVFFMLQIPNEQLQSVVLHELGHAVGLHHSCSASRTLNPNWISCAQLQSGHPYREAVMYPSLDTQFQMAGNDRFFVKHEKKENLRQNDQIRFQCLYGR